GGSRLGYAPPSRWASAVNSGGTNGGALIESLTRPRIRNRARCASSPRGTARSELTARPAPSASSVTSAERPDRRDRRSHPPSLTLPRTRPPRPPQLLLDRPDRPNLER